MRAAGLALRTGRATMHPRHLIGAEMIRLALTLSLLAAPALAREVEGTCRDGGLWWAEGAAAGYGPCDGAEEGPLRLTCSAGATTLRFASPYPVAEGQRGTVDLTVDGRSWRLEGVGAQSREMRMLDGVDLPGAVLDALAGGTAARLDGPAETWPIHLVGSGAAIRAMRAACADG
jgi:hypothetical protein